MSYGQLVVITVYMHQEGSGVATNTYTSASTIPSYTPVIVILFNYFMDEFHWVDFY